MSDSLGGGCLCGGVRYEISTPPMYMAHCHCSTCRKFSGAAHSTNIAVERNGFRLVAGEALLRAYRHENRKDMMFCSRCGSSVFVIDEWPNGGVVRIRAGSLDDDPGVRPLIHAYVAYQAPWYTFTDDLPRLPEGAGS